MFNMQERAIFQYFNGQTNFYADPLAINRKLRIALGSELDNTIENYRSDNPVLKLEAQGKLVEATRIAFDMLPFDPSTGRGALELDCLAALDAFFIWVDKKKVTAKS